MPVLFRAILRGLRVSEATNLLADDVDLKQGVLTIRNSKFGKTRYVPMSDELTGICAAYAETRLVGPPDADWFFAAPDGGHYDTRTIYNAFRELLWKAGISHGERETVRDCTISDTHFAFIPCEGGHCGGLILPPCCPD